MKGHKKDSKGFQNIFPLKVVGRKDGIDEKKCAETSDSGILKWKRSCFKVAISLK
jgi:hypothetical protein